MKTKDLENLDKSYQHLKAGKSYEVKVTFKDYDRKIHLAGEKWEFIGSNFVPYNDGLSLFAVVNGEQQQVRLEFTEEGQSEIIENLQEYLVPCE